MTAENFLPAVLLLWLVYIFLRFVLLELLTVTLRRIPAARAWFKRQKDQGRFAKDVRSPALFSTGLRRIGSLLEWITGRGWLRAPTFLFIAAITIFLAMLPVDRVVAGRAQYDAIYAAVRDGASVEELARTTCLMENSLVVVRQKTGVSMFPAKGFRPYPIDNRSRATWPEMKGERAQFLIGALLNGRVLTDDPAAVGDEVRHNRLTASLLSQNTKDGRLTGKAYYLLPKAPESEAAAADIKAICDSDPATRSRSLKPVREPALYPDLVGRARMRVLAFLDAPQVREAYDSLQVQVATSQFGLSFFIALAAAGVLWIAAKLAIAISRASLKRAWLVFNYAVVVGLSAAAFFWVTQLLLLAQAAVNTVVPVALGYALAVAPGPGAEDQYRRHANAVIAEGMKVVEPTCVEIGQSSPLTDWCDAVDAMAEPWDPVTRTFDFDRLLPQSTGGDDQTSEAVLKTFAPSMLTFVVVMAGVDKDQQDSADITLWKGVRFGSLVIFVTLPLLLLAGLATLMAPLLELRWTIVKRIDRIVR